MRGGNALVIFAKSPGGENVKTRLAGRLPDGERRALYASLLESTIKKLRGVPGADTFISYAPAGGGGYFEKFGLPMFPQSEGDLGERMHIAMKRLLEDGYLRVALVGVDIPGLTASVVARAFELLSDSDVVFGPATDGGYYLVGLSAPHGEIFTGVKWSANTTLAQSVERAMASGLSVSYVDTLSDIDRPEDLEGLLPE